MAFGAQAAEAAEPWVRSLTISGADHIDTGDLRDALATVKTGWWPFAAKKPFDEAAWDLDLRRIPAFYADRGYFDARVAKHEEARGPRGAVDLNVVVEEGEPTTIEDVRLEGFPTAEEVARLRALARKHDVVAGRVVNYLDYAAWRDEARALIAGDGYAYARVDGDVAVDRDRHRARITLAAAPGPRVVLGPTSFVGEGNLPVAKLAHRLTFETGDVYDPRDFDTSQGRLYDLGVFSSVRISLPQEATATAPVTVSLTPGRLHELKLGGGIGVEREREEARLRLEWTFSNFLGGLRRLRLRAKPAWVVIPTLTSPMRTGPAAELTAELTVPDVFGVNATLHALAGYDLLIAEGYQAYGPRAQLGMDRPFFRDRLLLGGSWNLQYLDFFAINGAVFDPRTTTLGYGFKDPYRLAFLEEFAQIDLRDQPLDAHAGAYLSLRLEQGNRVVGGDFDYTKITPEFRGYVPVGRRFVLAARALVGWLKPFGGGTESPLTRRFSLGGPSSHRGFGFGRLAPQVADDQGRLIPVGGQGEALLSFEARADVTKIAGHWLGLVPFVDAGDVTVTFDELDPKRFHVAAGLSVELETAIGVARVGGAARLNRLEGAAIPGQSPANPDPGHRIAVHFTLGEAF
jgi:translocation and assembly module TamA